jgi:hypothetical protein
VSFEGWKKLNVVQKLWLCALVCTSFNFLKRWLFFLCVVGLFIVSTVSLGIGHNVLQLGEVAELDAQMFSFAQKFNRRNNVEISTKPAILPNCC